MYKWEFRKDEENPEGYFQKLIEMSESEVLSLDEAAERLNQLEREISILCGYMPIDYKKLADEHLAKIKEQK